MLAVDIGNTFTRIAAFSGDTVRDRRSFRTRELEASDLVVSFSELAALADFPSVWVASVVPDANAALDSAIGKAGLARRFIQPDRDNIIRHRLKTPATTGADRLLSALSAGWRHFSGAGGGNGYVVVQCGSAATVDIVDREGVFRGGYILPGPSLWLSGLARAAQLPDLSAGFPDWEASSPGDNTMDAILRGLAVGLPAAVAAACRQAGAEAPVAVTGGWGEIAAAAIGRNSIFDPELLLHGIRLFAERFL